ncbi:uncharacterized protein LOC131664585 [Phymastichus coffea]|uniref:uncharacterized protein LOC131664585 n=1 Tax=Phymastichus coffea TaxID=108790 RepID=UPI00273AA3BB|nr:uncharacterized protein LOC131664585 [Phymastichus coffea]
MTLPTITSNSKDQEEKIDIKSLEPLLKRTLDDDTLKVIDYEATSLLPAGENYCSVLIKLDVKLRRNDTEKMCHFVAKTPSPKEKSIVDWSLIFKKELFMYTEIHPLYRELEKEAGIKEDNLINAWPRYIGHRNSLKNGTEINEDSVMLMENITTQGFYNMDRKKGLDVHHASKALTVLARYHALGIVMKQRRPTFAYKAVEQSQIIGLALEFLDQGYDSIFETIVKIPFLQKHLSIIKLSFEHARKGKILMTTPSEPWALISHGDFWMNNILFHKDEDGNIDDVKFVDFQMYRYTSPLTDLVYFLNGSLDLITQTDHFRELIDLYYNNFIETLDRMSCDTLPFARESFERELKKQAIDYLPLCVLAAKMIVFEVDGIDNNKSGSELGYTIFMSEISDIFEAKLKGLNETYERMGWF